MRLVFGSCCRIQGVAPQPVWARIAGLAPDALLLLGDNVYLDRDDHDDPRQLAAELAEKYRWQLAEPNFASLRRQLADRGAPLLACYDDHDFLGNDRCGGDEAPALREVARDALVAAFDPPRTGPEVYAGTRIGAVEILSLDVRFHRRAVACSARDPDAILGAAQWHWLEARLAASDAPYRLVASASTFHCFRGGGWERYPAAFARLRALLAGRPGALFLSGDLHDNACYDESGVIELVSSGISRRGLTFGGLRENFAVLDFDRDGVAVTMHGLKPHSRFAFRIALADWRLT